MNFIFIFIFFIVLVQEVGDQNHVLPYAVNTSLPDTSMDDDVAEDKTFCWLI